MSISAYCISRHERMDTVLAQLAHRYDDHTITPATVLDEEQVAFLDHWR